MRLLGRPTVFLDGEWLEPPPGRATAILLYLAFHGSWIGRGDLVYLFWPDAPEERARGNLRPLLSRLGREAYAHGLQRERSRVRWPVQTDLQRFRDAVAAKRWPEAWALVRGDLLSGFTLPSAPVFDAWLEAERSHLRASLRAAGVGAIDHLSEAHDHAAVADVAAALHRLDPLDEGVARTYFVALARSGARSAALAAFDDFRRTLADDLGAEPEDDTLAVADAIRAGARVSRAEAPAPSPSPRQRSREAPSLPVQATRFIGRRRELAAIEERIRDGPCRLLTIVGPGGVGKTRLALEVASRIGTRFRHGARFVDLASAATPESVAATIAASIGAESKGLGASLDLVAEALANAEMLLVLDNVEHLVAGGLEAVGIVMERAPAVTMLATSRVRLATKGERIHDLGGLPYEVEASDGGARADAVTLFVRAAQRVRPELDDGPVALASVARICTLVEGLPLALELAAAWLRALTLDEIERELQMGLDVLDGAERDVSSRHAGMRAVFTHSWSLLRPHERRALRALSVFEGGWTRDAAAEVAHVGMPLLLALIDASMIRRDATGRFTLHALVGAYARERAAEEPDEARGVADRHTDYFLRFLTQRQFAWRRHDGARLLAEVEVELSNVQVAWRSAIANGRGELLTAAIDGLRSLTTTSHRVDRLLELVRETVVWAEPSSLLYGRALVCLGAAAIWRGAEDAVGEGTEKLVEALTVLEALGARADVAQACRFLGMGRCRQRRQAEARVLWEGARRIHDDLGDAEGVAMMLNNLGNTAATYGEGEALLRESIALANGADELFPEALASDSLGDLLFRRHGATDEVGDLFARAVALLDRTGFHQAARRERVRLARVHAARGRLLEAQATLDEVTRHDDRRGDDETRRDVATAWSVTAWVAYLRDDREAACSATRALLAQGRGHLTAVNEALARTVVSRLMLDASDVDAGVREAAQARAALERHARAAVRPVGNWHDAMASEPEAPAWVRLLAAEVDLAVADARLDDARRAAAEGLEIALRSEQEPAGTVALVSVAHVLLARGDTAAAQELVTFVRRHPAAPFEALRAAERLEAGWKRSDRIAAPPPTETGDIAHRLGLALGLMR